jgi:predicted nuclease of predicted toxin-antitoxin system
VKFLADESIDRQIVERLRKEGHDVCYVAEMDPGISDDDVLAHANHNSALLITADRDFGELTFRHARISQGIILVRLAGLSPAVKAEVVSSGIKEHASEIEHSFSVISPGMIRIRHREKT